MARLIRSIGLAVLAMSSAPTVLASPPPARHSRDGFTYPGQSIEAKRYNERWDAYMARLAPAKPDPALGEIEWMRGSWKAQPREYPNAMTDPSGAELGPQASATANWTTGERWLHISFVAEPWHAEWSYFLGHDQVRNRWVMQYVISPSLVFERPLVAQAWSGDRLVFRPVAESYKGFREIGRLVIVRTNQDSFRIVSEVKMPSGKFVAMDDVLFTRASGRH